MKEEMISYLNARIDWYRQEQARLKAASCGDEAAHAQIAVNVCNIFLATYQAMKYDLQATLQRFSSIANT